MKKRWIAFIGLLTAFLMAVTVCGAEPLAVHLENVFVQDGKLCVYFNTNLSEALAPENIEASLGGQAVQLESLEQFSKTDQGTTWLFLADVSGSISPEKLSNIQKILYELQAQMSPKDNAAVATVGNDAYINVFTSDADALAAQIAGITGVHENTNLYAGIVKSLDLLSTGADVQKKKCLVILSDGEDYHATGYTREEVDRKIKEMHIPVYSVAMLDASSPPSVIAQSKILGSFARESAGGLDLTFGLDGKTPQELAQQIKNKADSGYVLTLSVLEPPAKEKQSLLLTLSAPGTGTATDSYELFTKGLTVPQKPEAPSEPETDVSDTEPAEDLQQGISVWVFVGVGAAALIALIIAIVVIRKKKAASPPAKDQAQEPEEIPMTQAPLNDASAAVDATVFHFVKVGARERERFTCKLTDELIIGRDVAATLCFPGDELLSTRHCRIVRNGAGFGVEDLRSTNGTYLNGVPVRQMLTIEKDDILLIGSMELRVTWE